MTISLWILIPFLILFVPLNYILWHTLYREQHAPADTSNRSNAIRLAWFGATREHIFKGHIDYENRFDLFMQCLRHEERFVDVPECWFLKYDEYDVVSMGAKWLAIQKKQ